MPTNDALQIFYGILPLILVIIAGFVRSQMTLHSIEQWMIKAESRLTALETRAGLLYTR